jgi:hypothetical protein
VILYHLVSGPIPYHETTSSLYFCSLFFLGEELEKLAREAGFCAAKHYELGGGLMGNLVATR